MIFYHFKCDIFNLKKTEIEKSAFGKFIWRDLIDVELRLHSNGNWHSNSANNKFHDLLDSKEI